MFVHSVLVFIAVKGEQSSKQDLDDVSFRLFQWQKNAFSREDTWNRISARDKAQWTLANDVYPGKHGAEDLEEVLAETGRVQLPVRIVIAGHDSRVPPADQIGEMESSLHAECRYSSLTGVVVKFKIEFLRSELALKIRQSAQHGLQNVRGILREEYRRNPKWNGANVFILLVGTWDDRAAVDVPRIESGRMSWMPYSENKSLVDLLLLSENIVSRIYVPEPSYFPVTIADKIRVHVHPYTPGFQHQALWYQQFPWASFEEDVRSLAPAWQTVGFFSTRANGECKRCDAAFGSLESLVRDHASHASRILGHDGWRNSTSSRSAFHAYINRGPDERTDSEFNIYVIDISRLQNRGMDILKSALKKPIAIYSGFAVLGYQSSGLSEYGRLERNLVASVAAGVYGVSQASIYLDPSSDILKDIVNRHIICSLVHIPASQILRLREILTRYGMDLSKVIHDGKGQSVLQRLNLFMFKLVTARDALSGSNNVRMATHYASAAAHDVREIRKLFGLSQGDLSLTDNPSINPAVFCRSAENAAHSFLVPEFSVGMLFPSVPRMLAVASFVLSAVLSRAYLLQQQRLFDSRQKRT